MRQASDTMDTVALIVKEGITVMQDAKVNGICKEWMGRYET